MTTDVRVGRFYALPPGISGDARFSADYTRRYWLTRDWSARKPRLIAIGTNPSSANHERDDGTIRVLEGLLIEHGFGSLVMLNAYDLISTDMAPIKANWDHALSPDNQLVIDQLLGLAEHYTPTPTVLAAWGIIPRERHEQLIATLRRYPFRVVCVGRTKDGFPRHVLRTQTKTLFDYFPEPDTSGTERARG